MQKRREKKRHCKHVLQRAGHLLPTCTAGRGLCGRQQPTGDSIGAKRQNGSITMNILSTQGMESFYANTKIAIKIQHPRLIFSTDHI